MRWLPGRPTPPGIFAEFGGKRFTLLWRGSRDGFGARDFHGRCGGHAPPLTLTQDTEGNVFGGFTPVEWASSGPCKTDPAVESFLFTLTNPDNIPARTFALKDEAKGRALCYAFVCGPHFVDMCICNNCNAIAHSWSDVGHSSANDTGLDGNTVFTGSYHFTVKEVEVFEITD
jgi:hypothetical protein